MRRCFYGRESERERAVSVDIDKKELVAGIAISRIIE
jgi:hypothetical protein